MGPLVMWRQEKYAEWNLTVKITSFMTNKCNNIRKIIPSPSSLDPHLLSYFNREELSWYNRCCYRSLNVSIPHPHRNLASGLASLFMNALGFPRYFFNWLDNEAAKVLATDLSNGPSYRGRGVCQCWGQPTLMQFMTNLSTFYHIWGY